MGARQEFELAIGGGTPANQLSSECIRTIRNAVPFDQTITTTGCQVPPPGWYCTREKGHDGPCAALPNTNQSISVGGESITVIAQRGPTWCKNCSIREGTEIWCEGSIAYVHGLYALWCKHCVVTTQLEYAKARAAEIPNLEAQLKALDNPPEPC